jgi:hypothetical protein
LPSGPRPHFPATSPELRKVPEHIEHRRSA